MIFFRSLLSAVSKDEEFNDYPDEFFLAFDFKQYIFDKMKHD